MSCGFNTVTRQKTLRPGAGRASAPAGPVPLYKNPNLYLGVVLGVFGLLFALTWVVPLFQLVYLLVLLLYSVVVGLAVLVAAFQEDAGTGFMTLCVPFYVIYFLRSKCQSKLLQALYSAGSVGWLCLLVKIWFFSKE